MMKCIHMCTVVVSDFLHLFFTDTEMALQILLIALIGFAILHNLYITILLLKRLQQRNRVIIDQIVTGSRRNHVKRLQDKRKYWVKPGRTDLWFKNILKGEADESEWYDNFRMNKESFFTQCDKLTPYLQKQHVVRAPLSVEKQVRMFLYYISDEGRLRKTGNAFGTAKSTTSKVVRRVAHSISQHMSDYIKMPTTQDDIKSLVSRFKDAHGFPQCIGAIDGTHVPIIKPDSKPTSYINKNSTHSLNVQAVADYRYCFLDVVIKWPGSVHDARIFGNSSISTMFKDGTIPPCPAQIVDDEPAVPVCLLRDPAYPLLPHVMKEFNGGGQNMNEQLFGYRLSSARMVIEWAFGRLKGRFRCLKRQMDINLHDLPAVIHACFILHNFCELNNNPVPPALYEEAINYDRQFQSASGASTLSQSNNVDAKHNRNIFVKYFM